MDSHAPDITPLLQAGQRYHAQNDLPRAQAAYRMAIATDPLRWPDAYMNLGNVLRDAGDTAASVEAYRNAVLLCPWHHGALRNLCAALSATHPAEAVAAGERLLMLDPAAPQSMANFQASLQAAEQFGRADVWARRFVSAAPQMAMAWSSLAFSLYQAGDAAASLPAAQAAAALSPADPGTLAAIGVLCQELRQSDKALRTQRWAVRADPASPNARWNEALALLDRGELAGGWDAYENRFAAGATARRRHFTDLPQWEGQSLGPHERLLVWREQGIGDEIMFASLYNELPMGSLIECSPRLQTLFARSFPLCEVRPELDGPLPPLTHQIACGSLPRLFRQSIADFQRAPSAYLRPDLGKVEQWRRVHQGFGISWRSMRSRKGGVARGYPQLKEWAPLINPFISLQYDNDPPDEMPLKIEHPGLDLKNDFDGVAALICALKGVVTVGNTIAALAPALGVPTAVLLREGDYTMLGTGGYPWNPNATVFVRGAETDWSGQIEGMRQWLLRLRS